MINSRQEEELSAISDPDDTSQLTLNRQPAVKGYQRRTSTYEEPNLLLVHGYKHIPPDGGWGWVVLFGSIFNSVLLIGTLTCFGVLFSGKMAQLGVSSTMVSWIFSLSGILFSVGVGVADPLSNAFGHRPVAFVSSLLASLTFVLLAFSNSFASITVLYGVVIPLSFGIGSTIAFLIVPLYFEKRRGRAMAALIAGAPIGGIVLPLLLRELQDHYGFAGAVLIHGAFIAHCCVVAALFRPVTRTRSNKTVCPERLSIDEQNENERNVTSCSLSRNNSKPSEEFVHLQELNNEISVDRSRQDQDDKIENIIQDDSENQFSQADIEVHRKHKRKRQRGPLLNQVRKFLRKTLAIFYNRQLIILGLCHALSIISYFNLLMLVPFALESSGHSPQVSARSLSVAGLANTLTRLLVALVADCKWFNRRVALTLGVFIVTLFTFVFAGVTSSMPGVLVSMVGVGVGIGLAISLVYTVMLDVLGLQLYATCIGFSAILEAIIYITIGPAIGALRDWSGSYSWSIYACAVLQLSSAFLLLLLPCAQAHDDNSLLKKQREKDAN